MNEVERVRGVYAGYEDGGRSRHWVADHGIHAERGALFADTLASLGEGVDLKVLDLGCGRGDLLDDLLHAGVRTENVFGLDLLPDRLHEARGRGMRAVVASGGAIPFPDGQFDLVTAFTMFSSVGDERILRTIGREIERVLAPNGSLVVYDLRLPSPGNPAVRPLPQRRLRTLFPGWAISGRSCTLLPPLARRLAPEPGAAYRALAGVPALRSHRLSVLRPPSHDGLQLRPLPPEPTVAVIMPICNEATFIDQSLGAVLSQSVPPSEVIVVDGHSDDGTPDAVRSFAAAHHRDVVVIDNPQRIVPVSMNLGLVQAAADVVIRVDGHCVIANDYVERCLEVLADTGAECVGGPMETIGETKTAAAIAAAQSSKFGVGGVAFRTSESAGLVDTLAFGAYRREVFDRIGGFDEDFVRNQDDELNLRLTRAGGRIWMDPSIRSAYFSRGDLAGLWRQYHGYGYYKVRVMRKHRTVPSLRHLVPAAFVAGTASAVAVSAVRRSPAPAALALAPYLAGAAASSVAAATDDARPRTIAAATATMHTAYGLGWWAGALRELRRR